MSFLPPSQSLSNARDDFHNFLQDSPGPAHRAQPFTTAGNIPKQIEETASNDSEEELSDPGPLYITQTSTINTGNEKQSDGYKAELRQDATITNVTTTEEEKGMDYEMHYGASQRSVKDVVKEILDDIATHKNLHDWDNKLVVTPFKKLETVIRSHLARCSQEMLNDLLIHSSVEEVLCADGKLQSTPAMQQNGQVNGHFFFSKIGADMATSKGKDPVSPSRGRVICVKECQSHNERAVLLWVHALCIRLQNEDKAYIRNFIERHLNLKSTMATPYHWQPTSAPEIGVEQHQKHYRRVSMSFHLTYLTMSAVDNPAERQIDIDRTPLLSLNHEKPGDNTKNYFLYKASSSTLMTLVIPEESTSREEETQLLKSPQGLWTVLMVNYPRQHFDRELDRHLTPISQFIRGITAALITQRDNAESICDFLRHELQSCDIDGLFDDQHFTKSNTYHRTIQGCSELKDSLDSTFRFMKKLNSGQMKDLRSIVHPQEESGVEHWTREMHEEIFSLRELRAQIEGLNKRAQESRAALHSATAVLEGRTALQQGQRLKVLAYLATLYLPLTAASSIYSMSVLPNSASFASFFVVLAVLLILTLSPNIYRVILCRLQSIRTAAFRASTRKATAPIEPPISPEASASSEDIIPEALIDPLKVTPPSGPRKKKPRLVRYLQALKPHSNMCLPPRHSLNDFKTRFPKLDSFFYLIKWIFCEIPETIAFCYLVPELQFPMDQYNLYKSRGSEFMKRAGWKWHPLAFVRDVIRALLLPLWAIIVIVILVWLMLLVLLRFFLHVTLGSVNVGF
ncbi:uncharacterized protein BDR25DRAFT_16612 [Lindgomyces ingoldianus]|uniref:Uncharacterized protein n=1 Tax=Lindgomyces ingoldianus TaxID=673940 RepID=A0ACB6QYG9_9PLEO|nr:uncharacterized protein BDR25DRAFT_16612 [Lindgomyces ingoldianus]KAF2471941.1 hypothetical protein BDR25DRAFT_16612 [Lindgomyces ingoldianus]